MAASRLIAAGKPVSRRALRSEGIKGSNQALGALARTINAELGGHSRSPGQTRQRHGASLMLPDARGERGGVVAGERVHDVNGPAREPGGAGVQGVAGVLSLSR